MMTQRPFERRVLHFSDSYILKATSEIVDFDSFHGNVEKNFIPIHKTAECATHLTPLSHFSDYTNPSLSLEKLAATLITTGPVKVESTPRRVRALFDGIFLFDTTSALHVWEHKYFPQFWVPVSAFAPRVLTKGEPYDPDGVAFRGAVKGKGKSSDRVIISENGPLKGHARVEFKAAGERTS
jgi:hypothetical protein